jgi:AraC-like DNA-binding protein
MRKFFTHADNILPVHTPRVLVETAVEQGANRRELLEFSGLSAEMLSNPETRMSYAQYAKLIEKSLEQTNNPALGLDVGKNTGIPQMGVMALAILSSSNLAEAMATVMQYGRSLAPAWDFNLEVQGDRAVFSAQETIFLPYRRFSTEVMLLSFDTQARSLLGRALPVRQIFVSADYPDYAWRYSELYDVPITFEAPRTQVEFDAAILHEPIARADPATAKLAAELCARVAMPPAPVAVEGLIGQVRRLMNSTRGQPPDLDELARALQTSSRSLRRSLREMGTSYLELLDESRRYRAQEWVRATHMTFEEIAERLGFSDVRSFRRAFKRWTGRTPGEEREAPDPASARVSDALDRS